MIMIQLALQLASNWSQLVSWFNKKKIQACDQATCSSHPICKNNRVKSLYFIQRMEWSRFYPNSNQKNNQNMDTPDQVCTLSTDSVKTKEKKYTQVFMSQEKRYSRFHYVSQPTYIYKVSYNAPAIIQISMIVYWMFSVTIESISFQMSEQIAKKKTETRHLLKYIS